MGTQYRSAIFGTSHEQILLAEDLIKKIDASGVFKNKITTEVNSFNSFFPAEDNHQKYLQKYPDGYTCHFLRDINFVI
jgi:peptide methionine sulfoxide reductase MsrA